MSAKRNEILKKRYHVYRELGYNSYTARVLSQRSLDVSQVNLSKKTGKLANSKKTKEYLNVKMDQWKKEKSINSHKDRMDRIVNDTVYSRHGMLTHDKRYKGETGKIISIIKNENKLSRDQAYYFYYTMNQNGLTYEETKKQLLTNQAFQEYDKRKKIRLERGNKK